MSNENKETVPAIFADMHDAAKMRAALERILHRLERIVGCDMHEFHPDATSCDGKTTMGDCGQKGTCGDIFNARIALSAPSRICDKIADRHKAIYDCRTYLKRHGYRLSAKQDEVMMQTIYWLYDQTKEAEVHYGR